MKGHILLINSNPDSPHPVVGLFDQDDSSFFYVNDNDTTFPTLDFQKFDLVLYSINPTSAMEMNVIGDLRSRLRKSCPVWVIGPDQVGIAVKAMHSGASYYWPESTPVEKIRQFLNDGPVTYGGLQFRREETLLQVIKEIALTMELDGLMNILMDSAMELSRADAGVFLLLDEKTSILSSRSVRGFSGLPAEMDYLGLPDLKCLDILHGRSPVLLHPTEPPVYLSKQQKLSDMIVAPIWFQEMPLGELVLAKFVGGHFSPEDFQIIRLLCTEISAAVFNAITHHKTKELTIKDDLTDAYNRRYFDQFLDQEFHRAKRYGSHLSVIFFDVDNLKEVNVKYGHLMGSKTLQEVAHRMISVVRGIDKVVRYGGDEFCIILPETDPEGAYQVAERLRAIIAGKPFRINENTEVALTGSFGIASFPDHAGNKDELIRQADRAMFSIKNQTKNAIAIASATG